MEFCKKLALILCGASLSQQALAECTPRNFSSYENYVLKAYIGYYGRPADLGGLYYWTQQLKDKNGALGGIIESFGNSAEFDDRFGNLDSKALITNLYEQILGRKPDSLGLAYYADQVDTGQRSLQSLTLDIMAGVRGDDVYTLNNRLNVSQQYISLLEEYYGIDNVISDADLFLLLDSVGNQSQDAETVCGNLKTSFAATAAHGLSWDSGRWDLTDWN